MNANYWYVTDVFQCSFDEHLVEGDDDEQHLYHHLDDRLTQQSCSEEGPERYEEVSARDACQVEQRVRNLSAKDRKSSSIIGFDQDFQHIHPISHRLQPCNSVSSRGHVFIITRIRR